jgi:hypothetical protein
MCCVGPLAETAYEGLRTQPHNFPKRDRELKIVESATSSERPQPATQPDLSIRQIISSALLPLYPEYIPRVVSVSFCTNVKHYQRHSRGFRGMAPPTRLPSISSQGEIQQNGQRSIDGTTLPAEKVFEEGPRKKRRKLAVDERKRAVKACDG